MYMDDNRLHHMFSVAKKMKEIVQENKSDYTISPDEAFILGLLHDIGYEFCKVKSEHGKIGGETLKEQGYKFWREVYFHGLPQEEYSSQELWLLNYVDLITGPTGKYISIQERINDIEERYGKGSPEVEGARKLEQMIKKNHQD